jgi:hypothetical protein
MEKRRAREERAFAAPSPPATDTAPGRFRLLTLVTDMMPRVQPSCRGSGRCAYCRDSPHPTAPRFKISPSPPPEAEAGDTPHQKETEGGSGEARADPAKAMLRAASTKPQRRPRLRQRRGAGFLFLLLLLLFSRSFSPPVVAPSLLGASVSASAAALLSGCCGASRLVVVQRPRLLRSWRRRWWLPWKKFL